MQTQLAGFRLLVSSSKCSALFDTEPKQLRALPHLRRRRRPYSIAAMDFRSTERIWKMASVPRCRRGRACQDVEHCCRGCLDVERGVGGSGKTLARPSRIPAPRAGIQVERAGATVVRLPSRGGHACPSRVGAAHGDPAGLYPAGGGRPAGPLRGNLVAVSVVKIVFLEFEPLV